jgi:hypothetical protein
LSLLAPDGHNPQQSHNFQAYIYELLASNHENLQTFETVQCVNVAKACALQDSHVPSTRGI